MVHSVGKSLRLSRLLSAEGRAFCIAFDHGLQLGTIPGVEDPARFIGLAVAAGVDGMILTPGLMQRHGELLCRREAPIVIMRVDQTTMWRGDDRFGYSQGHTRLHTTVDTAVSLGADAVITYLFMGHKDPALEDRSFEICAEVNAAASRLGILHVVESMAARGGLTSERDAQMIAMHTRIAAELGADVIKTDWPDPADGFPTTVAAALAPILVAGGPRRDDDRDVIRLAGDIVASGAAGILFGRNVFQSQRPAELMRAIRAIVHEGTSEGAALKLLCE